MVRCYFYGAQLANRKLIRDVRISEVFRQVKEFNESKRTEPQLSFDKNEGFIKEESINTTKTVETPKETAEHQQASRMEVEYFAQRNMPHTETQHLDVDENVMLKSSSEIGTENLEKSDINRTILQQESITQANVENTLTERLDEDILGLAEIEEMKASLSTLSFDIASMATTALSGSSTTVAQGPEEKPTPTSPPKKLRKKLLEKKGTSFPESETEPENLDDVIAGLKQVAEKDDSAWMEKARRKGHFGEENKDGKEPVSLFKPSKREDDDLESLASVDTDMAPMSENSRDLECTYSDLESISESVSSKGDPLLTTTKDHTSTNSTAWEAVKTVYTEEKKTKIELINTTPNDSYRNFEKATSPIKSSPESSRLHSSVETLPVEKLQAMIAELDDVLDSEDDSSSSDSETSNSKSKVANASPSYSDANISFEKNSAEVCSPRRERPQNPIEIKYKAVHVAGEIEFARANASIQEGYEDSLRALQQARVSKPQVEKDAVIKSQPESVSFTSSASPENVEARRVSIQSRETSNVVKGVTMELFRSEYINYPEEATLVTLESCPGSVESLVIETKNKDIDTSQTALEILSSPSKFVIPETIVAESYDQSSYKEEWIKSAEERVLEIYPEVSLK